MARANMARLELKVAQKGQTSQQRKKTPKRSNASPI
jgi:hypothetical protein